MLCNAHQCKNAAKKHSSHFLKQMLSKADMNKAIRSPLKVKKQRAAENNLNGNLSAKSARSIVESSSDVHLTAALSDFLKAKEDVQQKPFSP